MLQFQPKSPNLNGQAHKIESLANLDHNSEGVFSINNVLVLFSLGVGHSLLDVCSVLSHVFKSKYLGLIIMVNVSPPNRPHFLPLWFLLCRCIEYFGDQYRTGFRSTICSTHVAVVSICHHTFAAVGKI
jgi:hypothetical protein